MRDPKVMMMYTKAMKIVKVKDKAMTMNGKFQGHDKGKTEGQGYGGQMTIPITLSSNYYPVQMYSAVYKCVCKQYSEQLYADLMTHVRSRLATWSSQLANVTEDKFIQEFHQALEQYFHALGGIVPIFTYMNR